MTHTDKIVENLATPAYRSQTSLWKAVYENVKRSLPAMEIDPTGSILWTNDAGAELFGWTGAEGVGRHYSELFFAEELGSTETRNFFETIRLHGAWNGEARRKKQNGEALWLLTHFLPVYDEAGKLTSVFNWSIPLSTYKNALAQAQLLEAELAGVKKLTHIGGWRFDLLQQSFTFDEQMAAWLGHTADSFVLPAALFFEQYVGAEDRANLSTAFLRCATTSAPTFETLTFSISTPNGAENKLRVFVHSLRNETGATFALMGVCALANAADAASYAPVLHAKQSAKATQSQILIENSIDGVITANDNGIIIDWNRGAERIFGYTSAEAVGQDLKFIIPQHFRDAHDTGMNRAMSGGEKKLIGRTVEIDGLHKSGQLIPVELTLADWQNEGKHFVSAIVRDCTERKQAARQLEDAFQELAAREEEIRQNAEELEAMQENLYRANQSLDSQLKAMDLALAVAELNAEGEFIKVNKNFTQIFKYNEEELVGQKLSKLNGADSYESIWGRIKKGEIISGDFRNQCKMGGSLRVNVVFTPIKNSVGEIDRALMVAIDNTFQLEAQSKIEESRQKLEDALRLAKLATWELDIASGMLYLDDPHLELMGLTREQLGGQGIPLNLFKEIYVHREDWQGMDENAKRAVESGNPGFRGTFEYRVLHQNGQYRTLTIEIRAAFQEDGQPVRIYGTAQDITEKRQAERKLQESEARLSEAMRIANLSTWELDLATLTLTIDDFHVELMGLDPKTYAQRSFAMAEFAEKYMHPEDLPEIQKQIEKVFVAPDANYTSEFRYRLLHASGGYRHVQVSVRAQFDETGKPIFGHGTTQDVTKAIESAFQLEKAYEELRAQEEEIRQNADELMAINDELEATNIKIQQSERNLVDAMKIANMAAWEVDLATQTFRVTDRFYEMVGINAKEAGGYELSLVDFISKYVHPEDVPLILKRVQDAVDSKDAGYESTEEFRGYSASGELIHLLNLVRLRLDENGKPVKTYGVLQNITERKLAEIERSEREARIQKQISAINNLASNEVISGGNIEAAFATITETLCNTLDVGRASLWLLDENQTKITCLDLYQAAENTHAAGVELFAKDFPNYFAAVRTEMVIAANDAHTHPATAEFSEVYLKPLGINSMLDVPIRRGGKMIGVICNEHTAAARNWTQDEIAFAANMSDLIALAYEAKDRLDAISRLTKQRALEDQVRSLSLVASKTDNAVIITDPNGAIEWVNEGFTRISGYSLEDVLGKKPGTVLQGPDTDPETKKRIRAGLDSKKSFREEILNYHKNGTPYWLSLSISPVLNENNEVEKFIAIELDVTEQVTTRERMRELSVVAEKTDNAVIITTKDGQIQWVNDGFTRISGYTLADVLGKKPGTVLQGPDTDPETKKRIRQHLDAKISFREEILNYSKDGRPYWLALSITPILDKHGEVERFIAIESDVTDQKASAQKIIDANAQLQKTLSELKAAQSQLVQSEKMASLGALIAGVAHEVNTPISAVKASARNIVRSLPVVLLEAPKLLKNLPEEENALFLELINQSISANYELTTQEERDYRSKVKKALDELGVDDSFELAKELVEVRIIENIDKYVSLFENELSHEILDKVYKLGQFKKNLDNIDVAAEKTARVVKALKTYSHVQSSDHFIQTNLEESLDTILTVYSNQLKYGVSVEKDYAPDVPFIPTYPDELGQVWTNLISNAVQAMKGRGKLIIGLKPVGDFVSVTITDTGTGIPADILPRIFEPFFTTKPQGEGTGLGLDICKKIIEKHHGTISVDSEPGRTTFTVLLPKVQDEKLKSNS